MDMSSASANPMPSSPIARPLNEFNLRQAFAAVHGRCSSLFRNLSRLPGSLPPNLQSSLCDLQSQARHALDAGISNFKLAASPAGAKNPVFARVADVGRARLPSAGPKSRGPLSVEEIQERLAGVPVFALSNSAEEFVLVSGVSTRKALGLFCFKEEDAEALLEQMKSMDPGMRSGSRVVPVALNKVFQLKVDGVAFRLIPELSQIKNAIKVRQMAGLSDEAFLGVPVFQSRSLILKSQSRSYRPVFFRKEDLENSLLRASREQNRLNPVFRQGDIQVAVLEEIIKGMKENSNSTWDDVVFIPPGFDVATDPSQQSAPRNS
ncbi:protein TIC 22-like, chloroplastic isoform X1 [Syzygium oleosum]|uniref:protein TIC 22-like, chloroplastic isoform X1 n=1 Tax=Syzygium oleosum TaxID=219896 RepID=UPI0011D22F9C|nr:protein TIC 22-like, chloroplastic isoform X1 [Syzygium oleosum]